MPTKSTLVLKSSVTKRQAEPVPSDVAERLEQLRHHQAVIGASTGTEPAQAPDPDKSHQAEQDALTAIESEKSGKALKREAHALQAAFLSGNLGKSVTVFTINGIRMTGKLKQFDQYCLLLEVPDGIRSLVFKHAITAVTLTSDAPGKQRQPEQSGV